MNLSDFQRAAERTMTNTTTNTERMQNAALGLCGEAAELMEIVGGITPILDEAGDLLWYVAQMCKAFDMSIADIPPEDFAWDEDEALSQLWRHTGKIADQIKKHVYHQKPMNLIDLARHLRAVVTAVDILLSFTDKTIADACEYNTGKILKRFPAGFTFAAANARADEV